MTAPEATDLIDDVEQIQIGDVVREPGSSFWSLALDKQFPGPDGVELMEPIGLENTVSLEALARLDAGEAIARVLIVCPLKPGPWLRLSGAIERMRDALAWLRVQPTSDLVVAAIACHAAEASKRWEPEFALRDSAEARGYRP